jgi:hypothetical protein
MEADDLSKADGFATRGNETKFEKSEKLFNHILPGGLTRKEKPLPSIGLIREGKGDVITI